MTPHPVRRFGRLVSSLIAWASLGVLCGRAEPPSIPPAKENFQLFLLAGQSNMAGRGAVSDLSPEDRAPDAHVLALNEAGAWQPAVDPLHWDKAGAGVGIGKFFGKLVAAKNPGVAVGLIPTACGGSPISTWEPGKSWEQTKSKPWDDSMTRAKRAMKDGTLKAILWHQGESDANPKNAGLYEKKLEELINRFRTELNAPELPFIMGQLGRFPIPPAKPLSAAKIEVDGAQRAVAAKMKNVYFVSAEDLVSRGDNLHFSTASQKIFAKRYFEAYQGAIAKK